MSEKLKILLGIIAFIAFSIWYSKRKGITTIHEEEKNIQFKTDLDEPIGFGYKNFWIAVKSDNKEKIAEIIGLKNLRPSNWESGIAIAYKNGVFITPNIGDWTLVVGINLPNGDSLDSIEILENILNKLSSKFGEAHFFGTHRVVEYHNWMKSINGKISRIYSYIGESGENIKVFGEPTEIEKDLDLFNSFSEEANSDSYFNRGDLDYADEELVMKIANNWSINPTLLEERKDIKSELGLVGNYN